jgi:DivIVA domain-containing protein
VTLLQIILLLAVGFGVAMVAAGRGAPMADIEHDRPPLTLPEPADLLPADIEELSFSLGVRGYRMDEVDYALSQIQVALRQRDEEIARLREWSNET